jgi:hypothetical protein
MTTQKLNSTLPLLQDSYDIGPRSPSRSDLRCANQQETFEVVQSV